MKYESGKDFLTFQCFSSGFTLNERTSEDWDKLLMSSFAAMYHSGKKSDGHFSMYRIPCGFSTYFFVCREGAFIEKGLFCHVSLSLLGAPPPPAVLR